MDIDFSMIDKSLLNVQLIQRLEGVQSVLKSPLVITSGFRTHAEDLAIGSSGNSAHVRGLAVDIRCKTSQDRYQIVEALFMFGFKRIGIEVDHIHADIDKSLPLGVLFRV